VRITPLRNGRQHEAVREGGRQILQAVHRQIDFLVQQRPLQFPGEEPLAQLGILRRGKCLKPVAFRLDDMNLKVAAGPLPLQLGHDEPGLGQGQSAAATADNHRFHAMT